MLLRSAAVDSPETGNLLTCSDYFLLFFFFFQMFNSKSLFMATFGRMDSLQSSLVNDE